MRFAWHIILSATVALLAVPLCGAVAQKAAGQSSPEETAARERNTDRAMLTALAERRAVVAQREDSSGKRAALQYLDRQIADLKSRLGD
jgi:hypothetical protein